MAYGVITIPLTIIRWLGFSQERKYGVNTIPAEANFFALALFGLSGFLNVILLLTTKPLLFGGLMYRPPLPAVEENPADIPLGPPG